MYKDTIIKLLKNPLFILAGICLGAYLGAYYPHYGKQTEKYGHLYLTALKMSVIPFIFASVTLGVSRFFDQAFINFSFVRFLIVSAILLTLMSCIGALSATFFKPGKLDPQQISNIIESTGFVPSKEIELTHPIDYNKKHDFIEFLNQFFPENIFRAFSEGNILQIIAFAIIFGAAIGVYKNSSKNDVITPLLTLIQDSLLIIINAVVLFLPFGIFFLVTSQISTVDSTIFYSMIRFLTTALIMFVGCFFFGSVIIWLRSDMSYLKTLAAFREPIFLVLSTRISIIGMPSAVKILNEKFNMQREISKLVVSFGMSLCRYGNIAYAGFIGVFISQVYQIPLSFNEYFTIITGAIWVGISTAGVSGIATLPMLSIMLEPLGLPLNAVLPLLIAIDPILA